MSPDSLRRRSERPRPRSPPSPPSKTHAREFGELLDEADVIMHGYRPGALDGLGLTPFEVVVNVTIDAYGWTGPWSQRCGFDSLVQMSCGIADAGMRQYATNRPRPLPTQALDHGTGYLMAAAARAARWAIAGPSVSGSDCRIAQGHIGRE